MDGAMPAGLDSRTGFVGRQGELAELRRLYGMAATRWPGPVVVEGPAGIGKTALVRRFVATRRAAAS